MFAPEVCEYCGRPPYGVRQARLSTVSPGSSLLHAGALSSVLQTANQTTSLPAPLWLSPSPASLGSPEQEVAIVIIGSPHGDLGLGHMEGVWEHAHLSHTELTHTQLLPKLP